MRTLPQRLAATFLIGLVIVAVLADGLAGERPLVARHGEALYFPLVHHYAAAAGLTEAREVRKSWDWQLLPLIPYAARSTDLAAANFRPPLAAPRQAGKARHWLGTDRLGRDTLAGLISGTRIAVLVGLGALFIALLIGLPFGALAGFYGDTDWRLPRRVWWAGAGGAVLGTAYFLSGPVVYFRHWAGDLVALAAAIGVTGLLLYGLLSLAARWLPGLRRRTGVPLDRLFLLIVEVINSLPGLILLITLLSFFPKLTIWVTIAAIGLLSWTMVARYLRAELLRIRRLPYVEAARVSGVHPLRILWKHALPNAAGPLIVVGSFAVGSAILAEAMLSFLGVGVPADVVSWGSLLRQSRDHPAAWWLAVFPGLLLTLTVLSLNVLGEEETV